LCVVPALSAAVLRPAQGYVSSADYSGKRAVLVLFINGRPVECAPLKRALEATYASVLPKAAKPFVFLVGFVPARLLPAPRALPAS